MIINSRPQSDSKNGEKKGEPFESHTAERLDETAASGDSPPKVETKQPRADEANAPSHTIHEQAVSYLEQAQQQLRERAEMLRQRLVPVEKWVSTNTREHPYETLAAAGGAALLAGVLLRRAVSFGLGVTFVLITAYSLFRKPGSATQTDFSTQ